MKKLLMWALAALCLRVAVSLPDDFHDVYDEEPDRG